MGTPAYVLFCRNGHIAKVVKHHEVSKFVVRKCKHCGSVEFTTQVEWDYDLADTTITKHDGFNDEKFLWVE